MLQSILITLALSAISTVLTQLLTIVAEKYKDYHASPDKSKLENTLGEVLSFFNAIGLNEQIQLLINEVAALASSGSLTKTTIKSKVSQFISLLKSRSLNGTTLSGIISILIRIKEILLNLKK